MESDDGAQQGCHRVHWHVPDSCITDEDCASRYDGCRFFVVAAWCRYLLSSSYTLAVNNDELLVALMWAIADHIKLNQSRNPLVTGEGG